MDNNRKTAFLVLREVEREQAYSNLALNQFIREEKADAPAFVRELVYGVLEKKLYLDFVARQFLSSPKARLKPADKILLRMGLYQLLYMNSVPPYAAVSECVSLAKLFCRGREGFINGVLRAYLKSGRTPPLPSGQDEALRLSLQYSYAPWIVELWLSQYGREAGEKLLEAGNSRPPLTIRANTLKITREELEGQLQAAGFAVKKGERAPEALFVSGSGLLSTQLYRDGFFAVQDESSMLAVLALDPQPGDKVVDVCAAPGGKSLYCAQRMENKGAVYSRDIYEARLALIQAEARRLSVSIIESRVFDGEEVDETLLEQADRVLVDAPCSGLGVIRRKPEIKYKEIDGYETELPKTQGRILQAASRYVRPGGVLVYSTCTVNPWENERVAETFLKENPGFTVQSQEQIFPGQEGMDGFFISRMKRKA